MRNQPRVLACSAILLGGLSGFAYAAEGDQSPPVQAVTTDAPVVTRSDDALPLSRADIDVAPVKHVRTAPVARTAAVSQHLTSRRLIAPVAVSAAATHPSCNNIICGNFVLVGIGF
jgi:hypothetical protein